MNYRKSFKFREVLINILDRKICREVRQKKRVITETNSLENKMKVFLQQRYNKEGSNGGKK